MNQKQYLKKLQEFYDNNVEISRRKSNDYGGKLDPFQNFRMVEKLGIATVEQAILVRMVDKVSRISTLLSGTKQLVQDETVSDTLADLANYAGILNNYLNSKDKK